LAKELYAFLERLFSVELVNVIKSENTLCGLTSERFRSG